MRRGSKIRRGESTRRGRAAELDGFARRLLEWFDDHGRRDLPWQRDVTPYRVWVSEIMLQQTQVGTVIPYYLRFMERFPDLGSLAAAPVDDVLALWSGLGYYARARNLHRAAREAVDRHGSELPPTHEALVELPGIGRSTAAAILALSQNQRHAILDGNVKRVLARYHAIEGATSETSVQRELWAKAEGHTPNERIAEYTQAIMDLGATLCTRANARCGDCPVAGDCAALAFGRVAELPTPRRRGERRARSVTLLVVQNAAGEMLLEKRPASGIWGGLLSFPELQADESVDEWCLRRLGAVPEASSPLRAVEHAFTHFDLTLKPVRVAVGGAPGGVMDDARWLWYNTAEPLPGGMAAPIGKILREVAQGETAN